MPKVLLDGKPVDFSGYDQVLEFIVGLPSDRRIDYSIEFNLIYCKDKIFTIAHGWTTFYIEGKSYGNRKVAGIAYLHPEHKEEINGFVGMCKAFDHLVKQQVGDTDERRRIRRKIWEVFHKVLDDIGVEK